MRVSCLPDRNPQCDKFGFRNLARPKYCSCAKAADPEPGPGQLRIRVEAAGINFADILGRLGIYPDLPRLPVVVGYEVAGKLIARAPAWRKTGLAAMS